MGTMELKSEKYFAVSNGESTNYFRLRAFADTQLGVAEFRSGWFPADAVDALFGDVSNAGGVAAREAQQKIERVFADASVQMATEWKDAVMSAAKEPDKDHEKRLKKLMDARRYLVTAPVPGSDGGIKFDGASTMEYDVARPLWMRHCDEKLVFMLSSNPDEVIGKITAFANDQETAVTLNRLTESLRAAVQDQVDADTETAKVGETGSKQIRADLVDTIAKLGALTADKAPEKAAAEGTRMRDALRALVERVRIAVSANAE
jgi:hypothetical protein